MTRRVIADVTGSPRLIIDVATGEVVQRLDYDEFGRVTADTRPGYQPYGFQGGMHDPDTDLTRFGARDVDPALGRFTTRDPILFAGGQANLYEYAGGDPVNLSDPSGMGPGGSSCPAPTVGVPGILSVPADAYQGAKGAEQILSGNTGVGASNLAAGGTKVAISGTVGNVVAGAVAANGGWGATLTTGSAARAVAGVGAPAFVAGAAAATSVNLANNSITAALEGRPTPIDIAADYYGLPSPNRVFGGGCE